MSQKYQFLQHVLTKEKAELDGPASFTGKLISSVSKIKEKPEPVGLFAAGAKYFKGDRLYWKDPGDNTIFVGFGHVRAYHVRKGDGFAQIEKQWNQLTDRIEIHHVQPEPGTGPVLFGGFAFDQSMEKKEWQAFGQGMFRIPQILFTFKKDTVFLTLNFAEGGKGQGSLKELEHTARTLMEQRPEIAPLPPVLEAKEVGADEWKAAVANGVQLIKQGEMDKIVLARKMEVAFAGTAQPDPLLKALSEQQHDSYVYVLEKGDESFSGASPERLIQKEGQHLLSTCLAGSIKRSRDEAEDERLGKRLLRDAKNQKEHRFVVSMIQKVLEPFCSDLLIPDAPVLLKMRDIQHLYTPVKGVTSNQATLFQLAKALHPTPALGGIPRNRAMETIRRLEGMDRGLYGAPIGWVDYMGNGEFCVGIRSGLLKKNRAYLYAGCGVVADSKPEEEYKETGIKFRPMLRALGGKSF